MNDRQRSHMGLYDRVNGQKGETMTEHDTVWIIGGQIYTKKDFPPGWDKNDGRYRKDNGTLRETVPCPDCVRFAALPFDAEYACGRLECKDGRVLA